MWTLCECDLDQPDFRIWATHLYFHGRDVLVPLGNELAHLHLTGLEQAEESLAFLKCLTDRLERLADNRDLLNALAVIVADMICESAGVSQSGFSESNFARLWGAAGSRLLKSCMAKNASTVNPPRPVNPVTVNELVRFVSIHAPWRMAEMISHSGVPATLPLLEYLKHSIGQPSQDTGVFVGVQHLLGSTVPLIDALAPANHPSATLLLGKPYSTNYTAMWTLRHNRGYFVHSGSSEYDGTTEYHVEADRHLETLLDSAARQLSASGPDSLALLLDDGGRAIRMLHTPKFSDVRRRFRCVEQTRRGVRELAQIRLEVPVVNVAECWAKLEHESPLIADSVVDELTTCLQRLAGAGIPLAGDALIVGYGAIGRAVAKRLKRDSWRVAVYDSDAQRLHCAGQDGLLTHSELRDALGQHSEIIGCTGDESVKPDDYYHLRSQAVLISASSSDVEFSAWRFRSFGSSLSHGNRFVDEYNLVHERFGDRLLLLGDTNHPCHFLYILPVMGKRVFLVNGGFPVNMTGHIDPIPPRLIQLTRALLYAGAVQSSHMSDCGLIDLDDAWQRDIVARFQTMREGIAESSS